MFTIYFPPHPALADFVEIVCVMSHEFSDDSELSLIYTYMPTHTRFLCFYLGDAVKVKKSSAEFEDHGRSIIIGPQITPVTLDLGKKNENLLVILKPCALYRLLGIPLNEIVDCDFDAGLVIGSEIVSLTEHLMNTTGSAKRNTIIQSYLLGKLSNLKPLLPIDLAMEQLVSAQGKIPVDLLASKACLSNRQLERQSLQRIGLSPKYFARMIRFSEAYKFKERNPHVRWTEIAFHFGYYDQMHLIRDFHHFTGTNPSILKEKEIVHSVRFNSLT